MHGPFQPGQHLEGVRAAGPGRRLFPAGAGDQAAHASACSNLGNIWKDRGQLDDALACYRKALALNPNLVVAHDNVLCTMHYHPDCDAHSLLAECRNWNRQHAEPLKQFIQPHTNNRDSERPLRIGYVSPDFRNSFLPVPAKVARSSDIAGLRLCANVLPGWAIEKLQAHACAWRRLAGLSDEQVTDLIRQDGIDILVDLALHTASNRLLVFARKPAPVQVTLAGLSRHHGIEDHRLSPDRSLSGPAGGAMIVLFRAVDSSAGHVLVRRLAWRRAGRQRAARRCQWLHHFRLPE